MSSDWSNRTVSELEAEIQTRVSECSTRAHELHVAYRTDDPNLGEKITAHRTAASAVCRIAIAAAQQVKRKHECAVRHAKKLKKIEAILEDDGA